MPILVDVDRDLFLEDEVYGDLPATLLEIVTSPGASADLTMEWVEGLLDALLDYLKGASTDVFTRYLDDLLVGEGVSKENVTVWNTFISVLRQYMLEVLPDGELLTRFEHVMQKARVLVAETMQRTQAYETLQAQRRIVQINEVSEGLATIFDMDELMRVTANYLPELGIRQSCLALYEDPEAPTESVRLIMAHNEQGQIKVPESAARFDPKKLLPDAISWPARRYNVVVEALFLRDQQLGMAVFESDQRGGVIYEILRRQLNSAIAGALVFQEREASERALEVANRDLEHYADTLERRTAQLQVASEVAREAAAIQELQPLLDRTVELVSARFDFYHAGVFLIDDAGEYAVLQASSSVGGQHMLQRGHKLAVGETGIVGYVAAEGEARIALDVGADATFFDNPDLAETRSEMALPLRLRGEVIGVLDVQSTRPRAFTDEDVEIMQILADQLGLAIDNARLLSESQQAIAELEAAYGEYARKAWFGRGRGTALAYDGVGVRAVNSTDVPGLADALQRGDVVTAEDEDDGRSTVTVPLYVRDQIIGAIALEERTESREWSDERLQVVRDLAGQIGQSLETARLLEETQSRAQRERLIREISSQMRETLDIQAVLRTVTDELYGALDLEEVVVQLVADPTVDEQ
jgi:GAF domain-containing protein